MVNHFSESSAVHFGKGKNKVGLSILPPIFQLDTDIHEDGFQQYNSWNIKLMITEQIKNYLQDPTPGGRY